MAITTKLPTKTEEAYAEHKRREAAQERMRLRLRPYASHPRAVTGKLKSGHPYRIYPATGSGYRSEVAVYVANGEAIWLLIDGLKKGHDDPVTRGVVQFFWDQYVVQAIQGAYNRGH